MMNNNADLRDRVTNNWMIKEQNIKPAKIARNISSPFAMYSIIETANTVIKAIPKINKTELNNSKLDSLDLTECIFDNKLL